MSSFTSFHSFLDTRDWKVGPTKTFLDAFVNEEIDGETPLTRVLKNEKCSLDIVQLLLDYGADVNCRNARDNTPLFVALSYARDKENVIEALLQNGAQPHAENGVRTYICFALSHGASKSVIKLLLEAGCSPNACSIHHSPLECAADFPTLGLKAGVIELLIEAKAEMYLNGSQSPICVALMAGASVHDIKALIQEGASLDACLEHTSPWFCVTNISTVMELNLDVVNLLLKMDASMDVVNEDGWTPLHCALCNCKYQMEAIKILLKKVDVSDESNANLLHLAVGNDYCKLKIVKLLIELGLKADRADSCWETPLHRAVMSSCSNLPSVITLLLKKGCPVNAMNRGGFTPLKKAVDLELDCSILQMLLAAGARIDHSSLRFAYRQYDNIQCEYNLDILKMLVKYSFLENINFEIKNFIEGENKCDALVDFAAQSAQEVRKLKLEEMGPDYSLHDFVTQNDSSRMFAAVLSPRARNQDFNQLLRTMSNSAFPLFFDVVSAKLGKMALKTHLQEQEVYAKEYSQFSCVAKKSILDYDSLCWVMAYLSHADLLRMLIAYVV